MRRCAAICVRLRRYSTAHSSPEALAGAALLQNFANAEEMSKQCRKYDPPPKAPRRPFIRIHHGVTWDDPYHWMRDSKDPDVRWCLHAENRYAESFMSETKALQKELRLEMATRIGKEQSTPPERWGDWLYAVHVPQGKEFPVYTRRKALLKRQKVGKWKAFCRDVLGWEFNKKNDEVLIDLNAIAEEHAGYANLGVFKLSKDHKMLAYTVDLTGQEVYTLFIKDLETGNIYRNDVIDGVVSVEWAGSGQSVYYTSTNDSRRPYSVSLHNLGSKGEDILIYKDDDARNFVDVTRTKDWRYILVNVNSKTSSEVFLLETKISEKSIRRIQARSDGIQYFVEHRQGYLYILTNRADNGKPTSTGNYRLVRCNVDNLHSKNWEEIIATDSECWIEDIDIFEKHLIVYRRRNGLPVVQVVNLEDNRIWTVNLPGHAAVLTPGANSDFHSSTLRLSVSSPVMPEATYDLDLNTREVKLLQQVEVPGTDAYIMEHRTVTSHDNVSVPLTIVYSRHLEKQGANPALVLGYGAYGELLDLSFSGNRLSLLDRGWLLAIAHVRGGGTFGKAWHANGKLLSKKNSFKDFLAAVNYLIENKYASSSKIAAWGESAGGLLVGASVNMEPQRFTAVILKVPFVDILNTMMDASLSLTEHEYDEWGDPSEKRFFDYIREYSPYDNIKLDTSYPAMLVAASFLDTRVGYWEAAKWVAALRHANPNSSKPLLLRTNMYGGHFGDGGRYSHLREIAYDYAFLIHAMDKRTKTIVSGAVADNG